MRIKQIHIENFGRLSDETIEFSDGLNEICRENGWGKTTLAAFIRAMFFSFPVTGIPRSGVTDNDRLRYRPWKGGVYGGSLTFSDGKGSYIIRRTFGERKNRSQDTFELTDALTRRRSTAYSEKVGEELFGINDISFVNTAFIGQQGAMYRSGSNISAKISSGSMHAEETLQEFDPLIEKMDKRLAALSPTRSSGKIKSLTDRLTGLQNEIRRGPEIDEAIERLTEARGEKRRELKTCLNEREKLEELREKYSIQSDRIAMLKQYEALREEVMAGEAAGDLPPDEEILSAMNRWDERRTLLAELEGKVREKQRLVERAEQLEEFRRVNVEARVNHEETGFHAQKIKKLEQLQALKGSLQEEKSRLQRNEDRTGLLQDRLLRQNAGRKGNQLSVILIAGGVFLCLLSLLIPSGGSSLGKAVLLIGLLSAAGGAALFPAGKKKKSAGRMADRETGGQINELRSERSAILLRMDDCAREIEGLERELEIDEKNHQSRKRQIMEEGEKPDGKELRNTADIQRLAAEIPVLAGKAAGMEEETAAFLSRFYISYDPQHVAEDLNNLRQEAGLRRSAQDRLAAFMRKNPGMESAVREKLPEDPAQIPAMEGFSGEPAEIPSMEALNRQIADQDRKILKIREIIANLDDQIAGKDDDRAEITGKEEEKAAAEEKLEAYRREYRLIEETRKNFCAAKDLFFARYMNPIQSSFRKYFGMAAPQADEEKGERETYVIDADYNLLVESAGAVRETAVLSRGFQDLAGLCMRFALLDAMYEQEKPCVVMDDTFVNLDDDKYRRASRMLLQLEGEYQIIYLTCSETRTVK